jgi:predicted RNA-binding protein with TRAM domain
MISGRSRRPKIPAGPHISTVIGDSVTAIGPVLAVFASMDMRKELETLVGAWKNNNQGDGPYSLVAFVIFIKGTSRVELLTIACVIAFILVDFNLAKICEDLKLNKRCIKTPQEIDKNISTRRASRDEFLLNT